MNNEMIPFEECPVGMFMSDDGELCLKTEYGLEAYIVSSGERFWGGVDTLEKLRHVKVCPVDAEPVRHGHWIEDHMDWKCSCCNTVFHDDLEWILAYDGQAMPKYCPECGAKMDEQSRA